MVGIILLSHGDYAYEIVNTIESVYGKHHNIIPIALSEQESLNSFEKRLKKTIDESSDNEFLILVDFLGGTPFNSTQQFVMKDNIEIVAGVNIPMVLGIVSNRDKGLKELSKIAEDTGKSGIVNITQMIKNKLNEEIVEKEKL